MNTTFQSLALLISLTLCVGNATGQHASTPEDREALFDYIYEKTLEREAFSAIKEQHLAFDPRQAMLSLKDEVVNANTDVELYYALQKLSASRRDRHLSISTIEGGLKLHDISPGQAPIRFHPDYSKSGEYFLFVSDWGKQIDNHLDGQPAPAIGDKLLTINGKAANEYLQEMAAYTRHSNLENLWRRAAFDISARSHRLPPAFYQDRLTLTLENSEGSIYEISLPYLGQVEWTYGRVFNNYQGFELVADLDFESFRVYRPLNPDTRALLLWWYGFRSDLPAASDALVEWADGNGLLDYDLIIDAVDSRGGSQGAYALARLTNQPFKTTGGNLKLSDITDDFINAYTERYLTKKAAMDGSGREAEDDGSWVMEWFHGPVMKGLAAGQAYSNNAPFKCAHLPHYSDWIMPPAEKHFTGKMVAFFGPWGGSHLSQFAAMLKDNDLAYTIGMPDGGYSNTWEWEEDLFFPISKQPVVRFMWNIGHTIRPNGQILEGNPTMVDEFIPVTAQNYLEYKRLLLERGLKWLGNESRGIPAPR